MEEVDIMLHSACEYLMYADRNEIDKELIEFVPASSFSPYMECLTNILNEIDIEDHQKNKVEVNPFFRYETIFSKLITADGQGELQELKDFLFDRWIHAIYDVERVTGMTKHSFCVSIMKEEILQGAWGPNIQKGFLLFDTKEQDDILENICKLYQGGDGQVLFCETLKRIFTDPFVYVLKEQQILIYLGERENARAKKKLQFLQSVFCPMNMTTDIFWNKHFGVVDIDETMLLDEIALV